LECASPLALWHSCPPVEKRQRTAAVQNHTGFRAVFASVFIRVHPWFELKMSLKAFHLIFVTLLTALSFGFAAWAFGAGRPGFGVAGIATGILVIIYGFYFLKKLKKISYL
jgi:hypothetical protein